MPFGRRSLPETVPANVREWRPQEVGAGSARSIADPIIEPHWEGIHVLAHLANGGVSLVDAEGVDETEEFSEEAAAITAAIDAGEAIVDGFLTVQARDIVTDPLALPQPPSASEHAKRMIVGEHTSDRLAIPQPSVRSERVQFVAVDLLSIDGERLLDVPLLERRRLLEGAVTRTDTVSVTSYAQPPADAFTRGCRTVGFWALLYKGQNSRYVPGSHSPDWALVRIPSR